MRVFLLLITISASQAALVTWIPNDSFNLAINFRDKKLPCPQQTVVFPEVISDTVSIKSNIDVQGLVLPRDGDIYLEDSITFETEPDSSCTNKGNSYYVPKTQSEWAQPDVWSSAKFNEATPDAERIPCYDDDVEFPEDSQFTVVLPDDTQYIRSLKYDGKYYDSFSFWHLLTYRRYSHTQQFIRNRFGMAGVSIVEERCNDPNGCPCQTYPLAIDCELKYCPRPKCLAPIKPAGHCCNICGGYLWLVYDSTFDRLSFEETVAEVVNSYGKDDIAYHIGILPNKKIQLVVVEKNEFVGKSIQVVQDIEYNLSWKGLQMSSQMSGGPISSRWLGAKITFLMLFLVLAFMGALYVFYYKTPKLPEIMRPVLRAGGGLTRFNRRADSVVSLMSRRGSTVTLRSTAGGGTAFVNPVYDSKRGRVTVQEPVAEEEQ